MPRQPAIVISRLRRSVSSITEASAYTQLRCAISHQDGRPRGPYHVCRKSFSAHTTSYTNQIRCLVSCICRDAHVPLSHPKPSPPRSISRQRASREAHRLSSIEESHTGRSRRVSRPSCRRRPKPACTTATDVRTPQLCIQQTAVECAGIQLPSARVLATATTA